MKKKDWDEPKSIERRYLNGFKGPLVKTVRHIAKTYPTVQEITAAISSLTQSKEWQEIARVSALRMVQRVANHNARTWREAAKHSGKSAEIHRLLKGEILNNGKYLEVIRKNSELISSLPDDIARHVSQKAASKAIAGVRAESIVNEIREYAPNITETRAQLIARTETAKAQSAVTEIRSQELGVNWYIWRTSEDQRVRSSHKHMEGVVCQYSSPPSPEQLIGEPPVGYYNPGGIWNCRCYAEPVIDPDFLTFPIKVVRNGRIVRMSRKDFENF